MTCGLVLVCKPFHMFFLYRENCEAMTFSVSPQGNMSVKTLCSFKYVKKSGEDEIGKDLTVRQQSSLPY